MVKLTCQNDGTYFLFNSKEDAEEFIHVFKDHWCNISWGVIEEAEKDDITSNKTKYIDLNPKERAEDNLSWGFYRNKKGENT